VKQKKDGIFISQDKYVAEILRKFGLTEGKSASTPIDTEKPLLKDHDDEDVDVGTEDRTEMVRSGPGWSGPGRSAVRSGPTRHNLWVFGKTGPDQTGSSGPKTEMVQNPGPRPDRLSFGSIRFVSGRSGFSVRVGFGSAMLSPM
nr:uncharacterized mitochondrial protein AtMg00810-like [Tanacetum cinerariifolium]